MAIAKKIRTDVLEVIVQVVAVKHENDKVHKIVSEPTAIPMDNLIEWANNLEKFVNDAVNAS